MAGQSGVAPGRGFPRKKFQPGPAHIAWGDITMDAKGLQGKSKKLKAMIAPSRLSAFPRFSRFWTFAVTRIGARGHPRVEPHDLATFVASPTIRPNATGA